MNKLLLYISNSKIVRIFLFILFFSFLINRVISKIVPDSRDKRLLSTIEYIKASPQEDIDIMFFSNSYLYTAYDPIYLKYLSNYNSIHLGTSARRLCLEPYIISETLKIKKPKLVVVDISYSSLKIPRKEQYVYHNSRGLASIDLSLSKLKATYKYIPKERWLQTASRFTDILYQMPYIFNHKKEFSYPNAKNGAIYGYVPVIGSIIKDDFNKKKYDSTYTLTPSIKTDRKNRTDKIDNETKVELNNLLQYFIKNKDVKLLFINSVKLDSRFEDQFFIDSLKKVLISYDNIRVLELNSKKIKTELDLQLEDFYNTDHVRNKGVYKITGYLSTYLRNDFLDKKSKRDFKNYNFQFPTKKNANAFTIKYLEVLADDFLNTQVSLIIDNNPSLQHENIYVGVNIFPKKGMENHLSDMSSMEKGYENIAYRLTNFIEAEKNLIAHINIASALKKSQIDYIELWFWDKENDLSTNRIKIDQF